VVSRELEREFLHEPVIGAHVRDKETEPRPQRGPTWGEQRQAERSGMTAQQATRIVTHCWQETRTGREFRARVEVEGFQLARGDKGVFVLVDGAGEIHGLTRRIDIEGVRAAEVRARLADIDPAELPTVDEARQLHVDRWRRAQQAAEMFQVKQEEEEKQRAREKANERVGSPLSGADRDIADALRSLNRTMRAEVEKTIVSKPTQPLHVSEPSRPASPVRVRPPSEQKQAQPAPPPHAPPPPQPKPTQPKAARPAAQYKPEEKRPDPPRRTPEDDLRDFLKRPRNDPRRNFEPER
jgi:hypothetical protein